MNRLGIHSGADLKAQSLEFLEEYFGKTGTYYHAIARGQDDRRVVPNRPRKSVGSETTFMQDLGRPTEIEEGIAAVLEDVWSYCARTGIAGRTVTVKVKYADFQIITRSKTLAQPVNSRAELEQTSVELVRQIFPLEKRIRLLGVSLSNMGPREDAPPPEPQLTLGL
jgi:DNA polymerase-4